MTRTRFTAVAAVSLGYLFAAGPLWAADITFSLGAAQGTVRPLLGTNGGPIRDTTTNLDFSSVYRTNGIRMIRNHDSTSLDMATIYPDRTKDPAVLSSYRFTAGDPAFSAITANGFEPYFRIGDSFSNVRPPTSSELPNWTAAAVNVLRHYRQGQWTGFTSAFRYVEIWNEPNNQQFWPQPYTATEFNALYTTTAAAIKSAFPTLKVGGPGFGDSGYKTAEGQAYVRAFLDAVKAANAPLDFLSWHIYSNSPADYATAAAFYRTELDQRGYTTTESHITEWNTNVTTNMPTDVQNAWRIGSQGASTITGAWIALQDAQTVSQSTYYKGIDPTDTASSFYGMYYGTGQSKKHGLAFGLWAKAAQYSTKLAVTATGTAATGSSPTVKALAGQRSDGGLMVLIANYGSGSQTVTVALPSGQNLANYRAGLETVSDAADGVQTSTPSNLDLTVPGYSIAFLTLQPNSTAGAPQTGWWYNPAEPGRGYSLEQKTANGNIFMAAYMYGDDGRANWTFVTLAPFSGVTGRYSGTLYSAANGQTLGGTYRAPATTSLGTVTVDFASSATAAQVTWPGVTGGGTTSIQRYPISGSAVQAPAAGTVPQAGWYYDANAGGRGYFVEVQGSQLFVGGYLYRSDGSPVWMVAQNAMTNGSSFSGNLLELANGPSFLSPTRGPATTSTVGTATLSFTSATTATLTLPSTASPVSLTRFTAF